jgi:hypothetical protein
MSAPSSLSDNSRYEQACDQAIAMCDGNLRSTIKALIMANEYLETELEELQAAIAAGCVPRSETSARRTATPPDRSKPERTMADVTYYVALPFLQDDTGSPVAGAAEECQSLDHRVTPRRVLSQGPGSIGAVAFSRTGDPMIGEFGDAQLLRKFGNVPDDLSGL